MKPHDRRSALGKQINNIQRRERTNKQIGSAARTKSRGKGLANDPHKPTGLRNIRRKTIRRIRRRRRPNIIIVIIRIIKRRRRIIITE